MVPDPPNPGRRIIHLIKIREPAVGISRLGCRVKVAMSENIDAKQSGKPQHAIKKCPFCGTYLKREVIRCDGCQRRVGPPDRNGTAQKPVDWRAYISALVAVGAFCYFIYLLSLN